ncbi:MAG: hypothetical protein RLZZ335_1026 [Bacteroidota bacterium]
MGLLMLLGVVPQGGGVVKAVAPKANARMIPVDMYGWRLMCNKARWLRVSTRSAAATKFLASASDGVMDRALPMHPQSTLFPCFNHKMPK